MPYEPNLTTRSPKTSRSYEVIIQLPTLDELTSHIVVNTNPEANLTNFCAKIEQRPPA